MPKNPDLLLNQKLSQMSVVVVSHIYSPGIAHELVNYLLPKVKRLIFLTHALSFATDQRSHLIIYENGRKKSEHFSRSRFLPEYLWYLTQFLTTLRWVWKFRADLYIGLSSLNATSGVILRFFHKVKVVANWTIDYVPKRFENRLVNKIYHWVDRLALAKSNLTWNLASIMVKAREKSGVLKKYRPKQISLPHGCHPLPKPPSQFDPYRLIFMGHLREGQGVEILLRTLPLILKKLPRANLVIAGGGPLLENLQKKAKELGVENKVQFTGFLSSNQKMRSYLHSSVLALAPYPDTEKAIVRYGDPGKVKEYLAAGLPILLTQVPQAIAREIAQKQAGQIIKFEEKDIALKIIQLLSNQPKLLKLRQNALKLAYEYDWDILFPRALAATLKLTSQKPAVLILTPFFRPNVGGLETHLTDLTNYLLRQGWKVKVLTFQPLSQIGNAPALEKKGNLEIKRIFWWQRIFYYRLEKSAFGLFLLIVPRLLISTFQYLRKHPEIKFIHAQGLNAAFICKILRPLFRFQYLVSIHTNYGFKKGSLLALMTRFVTSSAWEILTLSQTSKRELVNLGVSGDQISVYTYWVDQKLFRPWPFWICRQKFKLNAEFVILFVGRLITPKGIDLLLEVAQKFPKAKFMIVGTGALEEQVRSAAQNFKNITFLGRIDNQKLPQLYSAADILIIPSVHEEGFGRVILEANSCGTKVLGSKIGGILEAVKANNGYLVEPKVGAFLKKLNFLKKNLEKLRLERGKVRAIAEQRFSQNNARIFEKAYESIL